MNKKIYICPETEILTLDKGPLLMAGSETNSLSPSDNETRASDINGTMTGPGTGGNTPVTGKEGEPGSVTNPIEAKYGFWDMSY